MTYPSSAFLSYIVYQGVRPAAEAERPGSSGKEFYCKCKCNSIYLNIREFLL
jgi:hypothetical protein